jgi:hypothetical protein
MNKIKIYLDTSVISHLSANDTPDKMKDTLTLWEFIKSGKYITVISSLALSELDSCPEPKRTLLLSYLGDIDYEKAEETPECIALSKEYLRYGVLRSKSRDDCRHISIATISGCKYIISWNFKHFVNARTIEKVQAVNKLLGYNEVAIWPPSMIIEGDDSDND